MKKLIVAMAAMFALTACNDRREVHYVPTPGPGPAPIAAAPVAPIYIPVAVGGTDTRTVIVKEKTVYRDANGRFTKAPDVAPVANNAAVNKPFAAPAKDKNPGNAAAEAEQAKMKAEAEKKAAEDKRKEELKAKLAAKKAEPAKTGGFKDMSKKADTKK